MNKRVFISVLIIFLSIQFSFSVMEIRYPSGIKFLLYIKDIKNLESNMEESGFLKLPSKYRDYIIEYLKNDYPILKMYQEFRSLDASSFIKSIIGETAFLSVKGESIAIIKLDPKSKYFIKLFNLFKIKGQFNGYHVDFVNNTFILSKNQSLIDLYKKSGTKIEDATLNGQDFVNSDVVYYTTSSTFIHPFLDSLIVRDSGEKSFSFGLNFKKKTVVLCTKPVLFEYSGIRFIDFGKNIPSTTLVYVDILQNPLELFLKIFGESNLRSYKNDFKNLFEKQISVALFSLSPGIEPSFIVVMKSKPNKSEESERFIFRFFKEVVGEKDWKKKRKGKITINLAKNSTYYFFVSDGYILISDSEFAINSAIDVISKKIFSVWDDTGNREIKTLVSKPFAVFVNFSSLANSIYKSMLEKMDMDSSQKEDINTFMRAIKEMGYLSGYGESRKDHNYFYFTLKVKSKEK